VTVVEEPTAPVEMIKPDETVAPAATVTDAGTEASAGLAVDRLKTSPPAGAGLARIKLFGDRELPPYTAAAARLIETAMGFTVRMVVTNDPFTLAVIVTGVLEDTAEVATLKADESVAPAATVTVGGTDAAAGLELERLTVHPPAGAGLLTPTLFGANELPPTTLY